MFFVSIRGAITVDENTREDILKNSEVLLKEIIEKNRFEIKDIISIIFTATQDLDAAYPAEAARNLGITEAGLLCLQEMNVKGSLGKCIRVLINTRSMVEQSDIKHVYLKEAFVLRPDLMCKNTNIK